MKRMSAAVGALALGLVLSTSAQAQETMEARPVKIGAALGATLPIGNLGKSQELGFHGMGTVQFGMSMIPVGLRADLGYHSLGSKVAGGNSLGMIVGTLNGQVALAGVAAQPYFIGGLGLYNSRVKVTGAQSGTVSNTDFGINVGGGAQFNLSGFNAFVEARFHNIFVTGGSFRIIPISFGILF